jgi:hypothetical protein
MYKVRMKTKWARPDGNNRIGDTVTLPDELGRQLVESGSADLIEIIPERKIESAVVKPPETAVMPKPAAKSPTRTPAKSTAKRR